MLACVMVSRLMSPVWTGSVVDPLWLMDPVDEVAASLLHPCFINHTNTHTDARTCTHPFITPGWSLMTESWECETKCRNRSYRCFLSFFLPLFLSSFLSFFFSSFSFFLHLSLYFSISFFISFFPSIFPSLLLSHTLPPVLSLAVCHTHMQGRGSGVTCSEGSINIWLGLMEIITAC